MSPQVSTDGTGIFFSSPVPNNVNWAWTQLYFRTRDYARSTWKVESVKYLKIPSYGLKVSYQTYNSKTRKTVNKWSRSNKVLHFTLILFYFTYICTLLYTELMTFVHIILWCDRHHDYATRAKYTECNMIQTKWQTSTHPSTWQFWHGNVHWICLVLRCELQHAVLTSW